MRHAGIWRMGTRLPGCCGLMAAICVLEMVRSTRRLTACDVGTAVHTWSASVLELLPYFSSFYAKDNSDPEVVGLLFGVRITLNGEVCTVCPQCLPCFRTWNLDFTLSAPRIWQFLFAVWVYFPGAMLGPTMDTYLRLLWCCSWVGRRHVRLCVRQGFGQTEEKTVRSAVAFLVSGRCPWFAGRADSLVQVWRRQSSHTDAAYPHVFLHKVVGMPFVNDRLLHSGGASLQFIAFFRGHSSCATWTGMMLPAVFLWRR